MTTDTTEKGLESLIVAAMTGQTSPAVPPEAVADAGVAAAARARSTQVWVPGSADDYDREHAVDLVQLRAFLRTTQKDAAEALDLFQDSPSRRKFLARLQGEVAKRGVIDVLRKRSTTESITSISSTARRRPATRRPPSALLRTASASPASSSIAATRRSLRSISASSSMACLSPLSS